MAYQLIPDIFPLLSNSIVTLREMNEEDLPAWFQRLSDVESAKLAGDPVAESIQTCIDGLEHHRNAFREKEAIRWSIILNSIDTSIGSIGLTNLSEKNRACEIGAAISRKHWDQGITSEAAKLIIGYAFGVLKMERIQADMLTSNIRSIRVLQKLGFEKEDTLRGYRVVDEENRDGYRYALLR